MISDKGCKEPGEFPRGFSARHFLLVTLPCQRVEHYEGEAANGGRVY